LLLVVGTSAIDWLERLFFEMTYYVSCGMLNPTHSLTHCLTYYVIVSRNLLLSFVWEQYDHVPQWQPKMM